jgi:CHRD domain-containing protein
MISLRRLSMVGILACLVIGYAGNTAAESDDALTGRLTGFQQVPSILSDGTGTFRATLGDSSLTFTLNYSNLSGSAIGAHIHFGQRGVNGAIFVFFCGGGGKPACPAGTSGTLTGTVTGADVVGVPAQGITAGSFADLVRILRSGDAYVNVHTANFPGGEIRAQIPRAED